MSHWGRDEAEWEQLVAGTTQFLVERARLQRLTSYTELNAALGQRTGVRMFDFSQESERAAVGEVLGEVARQQLTQVGGLLSAIVIYLNDNDAGPGFYRLAISLGLLGPRPTPDAKLVFWTSQVEAVQNHFR